MSSSKPTIGFVGVGLMGHGMAKNLVAKGWPLVVLGHRKREPVEHLKLAKERCSLRLEKEDDPESQKFYLPAI